MLRQIMAHMVKGELGLRLEIWRQLLRIDKDMRNASQFAAMQASLASQMRAQRQDAGLHMLRQVLARIAKGKMALRVEVWRTGCAYHRHSQELLRLRRDLEEDAAQQRKGAGLRLLRQIIGVGAVLAILLPWPAP